MRLLPRDERFFELFVQVATVNLQAAEELHVMLQQESGRRGHHVDAIKRLEHEADELTLEVVTRLDRSFITPLDREDIHLLASRLDDVIDLIDGTARRTQIFRTQEAPRGISMLTEVIVRVCKQLLDAVKVLESRKAGPVISACGQVKKLEEEGDAIYHEWLGRLFDNGSDPLMVLKWKEIYDNLERTLDQAEDVANVLESVAIKHA